MWFLIKMKNIIIPQMSPMNWFILFFMFNFSFYLLVVKNYYFLNKIMIKK